MCVALATSILLAAIIPDNLPSAALQQRHEPFHYNHGRRFISARSLKGFGPPKRTLFAPVLAFAPSGPNRADRALAATDRAIPFLRRMLFHPEFDPGLERVIARMPPRESTLILASQLYGDDSIPWCLQKDATRAIAVSGRNHGAAFVFSLAPSFVEPSSPFNFAGIFALSPTLSRVQSSLTHPVPQTLLWRLAGDTSLQDFGAAAMVDASAFSLRETYGSLEEPWDTRPGEFNGHDRALLNRLKASAPEFAARLAHYFVVDNLLDEFSTPAGVLVLVNVDGHVRAESLRPYPALYRFYARFAPRIFIHSIILDRRGHRWIEAGIDHGHVRVQLAVKEGMLAPLPVAPGGGGSPVAVDHITQGGWRSITTITLDRFGTTFGLGNIAFSTDYQRSGDELDLVSRMDSVPLLIAPPVLNDVFGLLAGDFLRGLTNGHGGMAVSLQSHRDARGMFHVLGAVSAELRYAPMLGMLAKIGDAVADAHNEEVRSDERRLGEELFNALLDDYNDARRQITSLAQSSGADSVP